MKVFDLKETTLLPVRLNLKISQKRIDKLVELGAYIQVYNIQQGYTMDIFFYGDGTNPYDKKYRKRYFAMLDVLMDVGFKDNL